MVCRIIPLLGLDISRFSNTSKPNRSGTRIRLSLLNCGLPSFVLLTSVINSLAALLPISIAANRTLFYRFLVEIVIRFYLRTYFLFT